MQCEYFEKCGSCKYTTHSYEEQFTDKSTKIKNNFESIYNGSWDSFFSSDGSFRSRAEFRIWHDGDKINYAMNGQNKGDVVLIDSCSIVNQQIATLMPKIIKELELDLLLSERLFAIEFMTGSLSEVLVTLIYHKKLNEEWEKIAKELADKLKIKIIGRSRKQKVVLSDDYIEHSLVVDGKEFKYRYHEGGFTQPNSKVNQDMISWIASYAKDLDGDLIELYCGAGNFTIPLSKYFDKTLATEVSKTSIKAAIYNTELNDVENISFIRLSSEEFTQALNKEREFNRLKGVDIDSFDLKTIFIDPPRAGLDDGTRKLVQDFENILYISCNPETLHRDLEELQQSHEIINMSMFDQFPYTFHMECGAILKKK